MVAMHVAFQVARRGAIPLSANIGGSSFELISQPHYCSDLARLDFQLSRYFKESLCGRAKAVIMTINELTEEKDQNCSCEGVKALQQSAFLSVFSLLVDQTSYTVCCITIVIQLKLLHLCQNELQHFHQMLFLQILSKTALNSSLIR